MGLRKLIDGQQTEATYTVGRGPVGEVFRGATVGRGHGTIDGGSNGSISGSVI